MAAGFVTPSCAQVKVTVVAVVLTGTDTLVPQVVAVQVPQLLGPPAESVVGAAVAGSVTNTDIGPPVPDTVNEMPV